MSEYKSLVEQIVDIIGTQCILSNDTAYDLANKIIDCFVYPVNEHEIAKKDLEWIPVSEGLPMNLVLVLVTYIDEDADCSAVDIGYYTSRGFCDRDFNMIEVTAWMPLIRAYEAR